MAEIFISHVKSVIWIKQKVDLTSLDSKRTHTYY